MAVLITRCPNLTPNVTNIDGVLYPTVYIYTYIFQKPQYNYHVINVTMVIEVTVVIMMTMVTMVAVVTMINMIIIVEMVIMVEMIVNISKPPKQD